MKKKFQNINNPATVSFIAGLVVLVLADVVYHALVKVHHLKLLAFAGAVAVIVAVVVFFALKWYKTKHNVDKARVDELALGIVLDNLNTCIYMTEVETGKILFINERMKKEFGGGDFIGKICWQVLQENFTERCEFCPIYTLEKNPTKPHVWEEHNTVTHKYYENTDTLIKWVDGSRVHMQHSVDITERKKSEMEIRNALDKLESVMLSYPGIIMSFDENGKHSFSSGYNLEKFNFIRDCIEAGSYDNEKSEYDKKIKMAYNGACSHWTLELGHESYNCFLSPMMNDHDEIIGVLFAANDITNTVSMQKELKKAIKFAEQASKAKSDFLSRMSHEMRTPMNAIMGMAQIAQMSDSPEKVKYCLDTIDNSSKHLLGLINDILDMSKIEAEKFTLENVPFNLEKTIMNVCNIVLDKVEEKQQTLDVIISQKIRHNLIGDELRLSQVLTNLLSNAVKFTPIDGKITLNIEDLGMSNAKHVIKFSVIDTGIGISPEQQKRLFTSFEQADQSIARKFGGTGLGLAISKSIVEKMDGKIWVESEEGKGSKFIFEIKLEESEIVDSKTIAGNIRPSDLKVLTVDDSEDILMYFREIMGNFGIGIDTASSGAEAVQLVESASKPYDVIFLDWKMPDMDGIETAKRIKQKIDKNTAIIMISASEWSEVENQAKSVGINKFIPKPLFPSAILNSINEVVGSTIQKIDVKKSFLTNEKPDFSSISILLVDDVEINRYIFISFLDGTGIDVDTAENGLVAYEKFKQNPDKYNMIIMDVQMPEMDGYEATKAIRELGTERAKEIPIVAMTANAFKEDVEHCLAAGMNDHIAKPVDRDHAIAKIIQYTMGTPEPVVSIESQIKPIPQEEPEMTSIESYLPFIDIKDMEARLGGSMELYPTLLQSYLKSDCMADIKAHLAEGNTEAARAAVHTIKGMVANLSLSEAYKKTQDVELKIKENTLQEDDIVELEHILSMTNVYVKKLIEAMEKDPNLIA